jgi:hypothetical protein
MLDRAVETATGRLLFGGVQFVLLVGLAAPLSPLGYSASVPDALSSYFSTAIRNERSAPS